MVSAKALTLIAIVSEAIAASFKCKYAPVVPLAGATASLPSPIPTAVLKKIALGHGLQNYTCTSSTQTAAAAAGALAVLYDITPLYPGKPGGLTEAQFNALSTTVLYRQDLPLNMLQSGPSKYIAAPNPWIPPTDLVLGGVAAKFLGHHYFDFERIPTFDMRDTANIVANVVRNDSVAAPLTADKGPMETGAVAWLQLTDSRKGRSLGADCVYRVITAGGNPLPCSETGPGTFSVPYTTFHWFYKFYV